MLRVDPLPFPPAVDVLRHRRVACSALAIWIPVVLVSVHGARGLHYHLGPRQSRGPWIPSDSLFCPLRNFRTYISHNILLLLDLCLELWDCFVRILGH